MRRILPLILLLVLVPAIATAVLLLGSGGGRVAKGAQPGGLVRGVVRATGGIVLEAEPVEVVAVNALGVEQPLGVRTRTDAEGRFACDLPAVEGGYVVRFGGVQGVREDRPLSLIGREPGEEPAEWTVVLRRAAKLRIELPQAVRGRWLVEGMTVGTGLLGFGSAPWRAEGVVDGSAVDVPGLPPMDARVLVRAEDGTRWEWQVTGPAAGVTLRVD